MGNSKSRSDGSIWSAVSLRDPLEVDFPPRKRTGLKCFNKIATFRCLLGRRPIIIRDKAVLAHFMLNERLQHATCWGLRIVKLTAIIIHDPEQRTLNSLEQIRLLTILY